MKKSTIGLIGLFIILLVVGTALFRSRGPVKITLTNGSSITVTNVQVDGEHFAQFLGTMTPGMIMSFTLSRPSEKNIWVTFNANGQTFESRGKIESGVKPDLIYFNASSRQPLSLTIGTDLRVVSSGNVKRY